MSICFGRVTLMDVLSYLSPYPSFYSYYPFFSYSVGAKLRYMGYFCEFVAPLGRKSWLLFSVRDMSGGLRNPCFTKFSVVDFL